MAASFDERLFTEFLIGPYFVFLFYKKTALDHRHSETSQSRIHFLSFSFPFFLSTIDTSIVVSKRKKKEMIPARAGNSSLSISIEKGPPQGGGGRRRGVGLGVAEGGGRLKGGGGGWVGQG